MLVWPVFFSILLIFFPKKQFFFTYSLVHSFCFILCSNSLFSIFIFINLFLLFLYFLCNSLDFCVRYMILLLLFHCHSYLMPFVLLFWYINGYRTTFWRSNLIWILQTHMGDWLNWVTFRPLCSHENKWVKFIKVAWQKVL